MIVEEITSIINAVEIPHAERADVLNHVSSLTTDIIMDGYEITRIINAVRKYPTQNVPMF
ncbi:MAG: hypothetical protein H6925_05010 [Holosporaceae bacterium]|nr:MAG: hypothetical protein H6925_05010 [Holosporaceae bacterium]